jgi:hypothetical protein
MRIRAHVCLGLTLTLFSAVVPLIAADYPATFTVEGKGKAGESAVSSTFTIHIEALMEERHRVRATDALRYGGYPKFYEALRALPAVGTIAFAERKVQIRFAREQPAGDKRRLTLVADTPLFFLGGDSEKTRAGFNLTVVDLEIDAKGAITGVMAGAARVRPSPPDSVVLDDFAVAPITLTGRVQKP